MQKSWVLLHRTKYGVKPKNGIPWIYLCEEMPVGLTVRHITLHNLRYAWSAPRYLSLTNHKDEAKSWKAWVGRVGNGLDQTGSSSGGALIVEAISDLGYLSRPLWYLNVWDYNEYQYTNIHKFIQGEAETEEWSQKDTWSRNLVETRRCVANA